MNEPLKELDGELDEGQIADYLSRHPDFFGRHEDLLEALIIPHPLRGQAVSLLERKVELLREENYRLRTRVKLMTRNARSNEELMERVQELMLNFLASEGVEGALSMLRDWLRDDFHADAVAVRLMTESESDSPDLVLRGDPGWNRFRALLNEQRPECGRFSSAQLEFLFADEASRVGSAVLIPLCAPGSAASDCAGVMAIASADPSRFHTDMGTLFLGHMGAIIGHELSRRLSLLQ